MSNRHMDRNAEEKLLSLPFMCRRTRRASFQAVEKTAIWSQPLNSRLSWSPKATRFNTNARPVISSGPGAVFRALRRPTVTPMSSDQSDDKEVTAVGLSWPAEKSVQITFSSEPGSSVSVSGGIHGRNLPMNIRYGRVHGSWLSPSRSSLRDRAFASAIATFKIRDISHPVCLVESGCCFFRYGISSGLCGTGDSTVGTPYVVPRSQPSTRTLPSYGDARRGAWKRYMPASRCPEGSPSTTPPIPGPVGPPSACPGHDVVSGLKQVWIDPLEGPTSRWATVSVTGTRCETAESHIEKDVAVV